MFGFNNYLRFNSKYIKLTHLHTCSEITRFFFWCYHYRSILMLSLPLKREEVIFISLSLAGRSNDKLDVSSEGSVRLFSTALDAHDAFVFCKLNRAESRIMTTHLANQSFFFVEETKTTQMILELRMVVYLNWANNMIFRQHLLYHGLSAPILSLFTVTHDPVPLSVVWCVHKTGELFQRMPLGFCFGQLWVNVIVHAIASMVTLLRQNCF